MPRAPDFAIDLEMDAGGVCQLQGLGRAHIRPLQPAIPVFPDNWVREFASAPSRTVGLSHRPLPSALPSAPSGTVRWRGVAKPLAVSAHGPTVLVNLPPARARTRMVPAGDDGVVPFAGSSSSLRVPAATRKRWVSRSRSTSRSACRKKAISHQSVQTLYNIKQNQPVKCYFGKRGKSRGGQGERALARMI